MYCCPAMACCRASTDAGISSVTDLRILPAKAGSHTETELVPSGGSHTDTELVPSGGSHTDTELVASGFSRKAAAGTGLPPEGGSHTVRKRETASARRA